MIERIEQLREQAEAEIAKADTSEALEGLRVGYLGRKAELPQLLRGVAELEPARAGRGRQGRQPGPAGAGGIDRGARGAVGRGGAGARSTGGPRRRDAARRPATADRPVARADGTMRELEDIFLGLGFTVMEGPEVETVHYNFDALNHSPTHPARARTDTFYVSDDVSCGRTPHRCRCARWKRTRRRCTW